MLGVSQDTQTQFSTFMWWKAPKHEKCGQQCLLRGTSWTLSPTVQVRASWHGHLAVLVRRVIQKAARS